MKKSLEDSLTKYVIKEYSRDSVGGSINQKDSLYVPNQLLRAAYVSKSLPLLHMAIHLEADINHINERGETVLMLACGSGNKQIAERLLKYGSDPNIQDKVGYTAAHFVGQFIKNKTERTHFFKLLKKYGADLSIVSYYSKKSPYACLNPYEIARVAEKLTTED